MVIYFFIKDHLSAYYALGTVADPRYNNDMKQMVCCSTGTLLCYTMLTTIKHYIPTEEC